MPHRSYRVQLQAQYGRLSWQSGPRSFPRQYRFPRCVSSPDILATLLKNSLSLGPCGGHSTRIVQTPQTNPDRTGRADHVSYCARRRR